jgi:hypothetical protein
MVSLQVLPQGCSVAADVGAEDVDEGRRAGCGVADSRWSGQTVGGDAPLAVLGCYVIPDALEEFTTWLS